MEVVRRSCSIATALLFLLTLAVLSAASASAGAGDDAAAAAAAEAEKRCHPRADQPYMLVAFHNKHGDEVRLLSDQRSKQATGVSAVANRSGHWFYSGVQEKGKGGTNTTTKRRRLFPPLPHPSQRPRTAEGFWDTLGVLVNGTATASGGGGPDPAAAAAAAGDDDDERFMLVGMETSGGDKIRVAVVADQRHFFITGFAQGWFGPPSWFFRDGERQRLLATVGGNGSIVSHAEVVAYSVLSAMNKAGEACC